jgi:putative thiazole/oxazole-modified microcin (TOMM)-like peptide
MARGATVIEKDLRFAELVARTWLEPALIESYTLDPRAVLAAFGLELPAGTNAPALPMSSGAGLVIEDLDRITAHAKNTTSCICWASDGAH